jgi:hypothetical protein
MSPLIVHQVRPELIVAIFLLAGTAGAVQVTQADPIAQDWEALLGIEQGVWDEGGQATGQTLWLRVQKEGGRWRPEVWGYSREHNLGDYLGTVSGFPVADGETELAVRMVVDAHLDAKRRGRPGFGEYSIRFKANGTRIEGSWRGTFCGDAGQGKVIGTVEPLRPRTMSFARPAPGEHPYLLLRKSEVPAIQKKLSSPWGQQLLPKLTANDPKSMTRMAVGHGLLYVLTGDKSYAQKAQQFIEADIHAGKWVRTEVHYPYVKVHDAGIVAGEAAIAFDLIYDVCAPDFRKDMVALFARRALYLWGCPANGSDTSNWSAMYRSGTGMCGLALLGEKEDFWPKPPEPRILRLEADAKLASNPPAGAPIAALRSGEPIADWLLAGQLPLGLAADPTEAIGGPNARIGAGTTVTVNAVVRDKTGTLKTETVTKVFETPKAGKAVSPGVFNMGGGRLGSTVFFATILENDRPGCYSLDFPARKKHQWFLYPRVFINGQRFSDGDHVYLPQGRFAVLAPVQAGHCRSNEAILWALKLTAVTDDAAKAWLQKKRAENAPQLAKWQIMQDAARVNGGCNAWGLYWAGVGRQWTENWATWAVGSLGWAMAGEAYTQHAYRAVLPFAHCYRNAIGEDLAGRPNLRMVLPRYAGQTMFRADGAYVQGYGPGGSALGVDGYARGFALVPDELKPAVLWGWNRTQKLADEGKLKGAYLTEDFLDPMSAAFMLVNYPDRAGGIIEENPGKALPKVLLDDWKGGFAFRNRWQDGDDIVATMFLNWNNAGGEWDSAETGDFRISGLGCDWAVRGAGWGCTGEKTPVPKAPNQNVLELGEPTERGAPAFSRFFKASKDGSAILAMDMDYAYASLKKTGAGKTMPPLPAHPRTGKADVYYDRGIKGLRCFAADYSGTAGVPALFAVVDKVTGSAGQNCWHLVTDKSLTAEVSGNAFTICGPGGATLQGTVLSPASPKITTHTQTFGHEATYDGDHQTRTFDRTIIDVPAKDFVFVVMTLQKADAPKVSTEGADQKVRATVGKQIISFDGQKIELGHFAGDLQEAGPLAKSLEPRRVKSSP